MGRALYTDTDGTAILETDAEEVQDRVRSHFEAWFGPRSEGLDAAPEYIRNEYHQPHPDITAAWFEGLMQPITGDELGDTLLRLPLGKAPGKSGLVNELWIHAGYTCKHALRALLNECLHHHEDIPTSWKQSVVVPIPKTAEQSSAGISTSCVPSPSSSRRARSSRPAILTRRLTHPPRPSRATKCSVGSTWASERTAKQRTSRLPSRGCVKQAIELLSLDVRRAYDSVSLTTLQRSLRRILRVPDTHTPAC